jgi:hypothetical protein
VTRGDDIPGFVVDRGLQALASGADVLAFLTYLGFQPKRASPALPVFILAALATAFATIILVRQARFAISFDAIDFPPGYIRNRVIKAISLFVAAAAIATLAALRLD